MKTSPIPRSLIVLCAFFTLLVPRLAASEKPAATDTKTSPPKFQLTWKRVALPEMKFFAERLKSAEARHKNGNASNEEVLGLRQDLAKIEERALYRLTIDSAGGTLREFIAATSVDSEVSLTLINAGETIDLEAPLPPFTLRNVSWGTVMEVLGNFLAARGLQLQHTGLGNVDDAKSVICVLRRVRPIAEPDRLAQPQFDSFQLAEQIHDTQTVDVIVDAIRSAWELDPTHDPKALLLKFHPATKMLFVSGPGPATTIARQVIGSLRKNPVSR